MLRSNRFTILVLVLALGGFAYGLVRFFQLRFELGDIYPPYSSLRADPLGTKVLYESLRKLSVFSLRRNYQAFSRVPDFTDVTVLVLGEKFWGFDPIPENLVTEYERVMTGGGRLVITFLPVLRDSRPGGSNAVPGMPTASQPSANPLKPGEDPEALGKKVSLHDRWGVRFEFAKLPQDGDGRGQVQSAKLQTQGINGLPEIVSWYSGLYFDKLDKAWRVIYALDDRPVVIERRLGPGHMVLCSDSYFASNEALRRERHPDLLASVIGARRRVAFDETHLGVRERPGVATLAWKYRLHGLIAGILLLAALFVWKNSVSFVPPYDEAVESSGELVTGKDSASGFVNLLRRSISERDLLGICFDEWKKSFAHGRKDLTGKLERIEAAAKLEDPLPMKQRNPVRRYQEICRILSEGSGFRALNSEFDHKKKIDSK